MLICKYRAFFAPVNLITIKIKERSLPARVAAWKLKSHAVAMVFGTTIHLSNVSKTDFLKNKRWLRHELEHVRQYRQLGVGWFLFFYLVESIRKGYYQNRFEVAARAAEAQDSNEDEMHIV